MLHLLGKSPQLWTTGGLLTLLLLVPTLLVKAQVAPSLARGRRVRLHLTAPQTALLRGVLVSADADSVRVLSDQGRDTLALPTARLAQVDLSVGQRTQAGRGALLGAGVGAGLGLALGLAAAADGCSGFCTETGPEDIGVVMLLFGGVGAGIGALIGAASHTESWVPSPSPWLVVRVEPARRRLGAGVRLRLAANH